MNLEPDRTPINRQAAVQLSRGTERVSSVEEALNILGNRIASPEFAKYVRQIIEAGTDVRYELTVKKGNQPGFIVALNYTVHAPKKSFGTFLKLT